MYTDNNCGVYIISCNNTNKIYIGSSKNIRKRWKRHVSDLKSSRHHSFVLQKDFNLYGEDAFFIKSIFPCPEVELREREKIMIESKDFDNLYNMSKDVNGGDNISLHPLNSEIRKKQSKNIILKYSNMSKHEKLELSKKMSGENNPNWKGGVSSKKCSICSVDISYKAYYCNKCLPRNNDHNNFYGRKHSKNSKDKISEANKGKVPKNIRKVTVEGNIYESLTSAAKSLNITPSALLYRIKSEKEKFKNVYYTDSCN